MKKLTVYLDTSVINFLFADDAPLKREITIDFFENYVAEGKFNTYISNVVMEELMRTSDLDKRDNLLNVLNKYEFTLLNLNEESENLGEIYVSKNVIPIKKIEDAYHLAIATVNKLDVLVSWNFKHLANINKERMVAAANIREGYLHPLRLTTQMEVMG